MKDIFKRLRRVARAEVGDLGRRVKSVFSNDDDDEAPADAPEPGPTPASQAGPAQRWPAEIRQAYAVMELPLGASSEEVRKAYKRLLRRYHPDKHQQHPERLDHATELTQAIRQHYELLMAWLKEQGR